MTIQAENLMVKNNEKSREIRKFLTHIKGTLSRTKKNTVFNENYFTLLHRRCIISFRKGCCQQEN